jgi:ribosomal protein L13E
VEATELNQQAQPEPPPAPAAPSFKLAREENLLQKWSKGGRLLQSEFEEIRHRLDAETIATFEKLFSAESAGQFRYEKPLREYQTVYGVRVRQVKRWIAIGRAAEPPAPPPLDEPGAMSAWWVRHMKQRIPAKLLQLNRSAAVDIGGKGNDQGAGASVDASQYEGQIADALREARTMLALVTAQLKVAYKSGVDSRIEIEHRRFTRCLRAVKEAEQASREDKKSRDELIPKAEILPELSELLQVLKHMRASRKRRTLERLESIGLTSEQVAAIGIVVEDVREDENKVLRRLKVFRSVEEIDEFQLKGGDQDEE